MSFWSCVVSAAKKMLSGNWCEPGKSRSSITFADSSGKNKMPGKSCRIPGSRLLAVLKSSASRKSCRVGYTQSRNTALGHLRKKYKRQELIEPDTNILDVQDKAGNLAFENAQQVHFGLARISLAHREAMTLFFLQDLAIEEIAEVLQIPVGTVKSRLFHAKRALRAVLQKEAENHE